MSPQVNSYGIARPHNSVAGTGAIKAAPGSQTETTVSRHRGVKHRLGQLVAAVGVCGLATTAVIIGSAHPIAPVNQELRALEAKGYVPAACTVGGILLRDHRTGKSVNVKI